MSEDEDIIIISDLHLAVSRDKGLFQSDKELAGFLRWVYEETCHCLLILNGDALDFLAERPAKAILDARESASRADSIIRSHPEIFDALKYLANSPDHQMLIVGGNHDPELIFPQVQQEIADRLKGDCSHQPVRWIVSGEAILLRVGVVNVLIEHGDQYDDWNYIDHESLRRLVSLNTRGIADRGVYKPPPGSEMVIKRFNLIRDRFPWIERLQPLNRKTLSLISELIMPQLEKKERGVLWRAVREFARMGGRAANNAVLRRLKPEAEFWAGEDEQQQLFIEWWAEVENEDVWREAEPNFDKMIARLRKASARDGFFEIEERDGSFKPVSRLIEMGNDLVIHGHTHGAKAYRVGQGLYLNSGTWGQLMRLPESEASDEEWIEFVTSLARGEADSFSRPTFIRVTAQEQVTRARLCEWKDGTPQEMSVWRLGQDERKWNQEG